MEVLDKYYDKFSAYVLDIEMIDQKYSGIEVAEKIRKLPNGSLVPIIFLTSHSYFGGGGLRKIHYYEFFQKPSNPIKVLNTLKSALSSEAKIKPSENQPLIFETGKLTVELDISTISCREVYGSELVVTDFCGKSDSYHIKSSTFSKICKELNKRNDHSLKQTHRCVIINVNRIKHIEWRKNAATVWLFNVDEPKPVGKTYLHNISVYNKPPGID